MKAMSKPMRRAVRRVMSTRGYPSLAPMARASLIAAVALVGIAACGCRQGGAGSGSSGTGSGGAPGLSPACAGIRDHLTALYRSDAEGREPNRIEQATADNVAMALRECGRQPEFASCADKATSASSLERDCFAAPDDEGSEGDQFLPRK